MAQARLGGSAGGTPRITATAAVVVFAACACAWLLAAGGGSQWQQAACPACPLCLPCSGIHSSADSLLDHTNDGVAASIAGTEEQQSPQEQPLEKQQQSMAQPKARDPASAAQQAPGADLSAAAADQVPGADPAAAAAAAAAMEHARGANPAAAAAAEQQPLLCGGPERVPSIAQSLADSKAAFWRGVEEDMAPYAEKGGFTLDDIKATAAHLKIDGTSDILIWMEMRNGTLTFPLRKSGGHQDCIEGCNYMVQKVAEGLRRGVQAGRLKLPEGVPFLINVNDQSWCPRWGDTSPCSAPLLSVIKHENDWDVMMPPFMPVFEPQWVPWEEKVDLAFFRGSPFCDRHPLKPAGAGWVLAPNTNCSRFRIPQLSWDHPDLLNATVSVDAKQYGGPEPLLGPPASHLEHAYYKYLINLDGGSASRRMATLLSMNSLVLKQESPKLEYYYRALKPCVHYLPFWVESETDILPLIKALRTPANQLVAQRLAANGQAVALSMLTEEMSWQYWQLLINKYVSLYRGDGNGSSTATAADTATGLADDAAAAGAAAVPQAGDAAASAQAAPATDAAVANPLAAANGAASPTDAAAGDEAAFAQAAAADTAAESGHDGQLADAGLGGDARLKGSTAA